MAPALASRVLVAAVGSTLRGDDGFGPALLARLRAVLPPVVNAGDFGTHGIALVQALHAGYDVLVLLDACVRGGAPGTVYVIEPDVPTAPSPITAAGLDVLADAHVTEPARALMLARALGVLPARVWMVGCEPRRTDDHRLGLSAPVAAALEPAARETLALLDIVIGGQDATESRERR